MATLSDEIIQLLAIFAVAFTAPTFAKSVPLVIGAILSPGRRTVAAALRMVGLDDDEHFTNYHRVLNRDRWSPWVLSKLLLALIIETFLAAGVPLVIAVDDTWNVVRGRRSSTRAAFMTRCARQPPKS